MVNFSCFMNKGAHVFILHWSLQIMSVLLDKIQTAREGGRKGGEKESERERERKLNINAWHNCKHIHHI